MKHVEAAYQPDPEHPYARVAALEGALYMRNQLLRDSDWASMAHGLELRVPLVDSVLLETLAPALAAGAIDGKRLLATSPVKPLPMDVVRRTKTGFSIPIADWLEQGLAGLDSWRSVPMLADERCPWARRLAYSLDQLDR
jgi:asparagine synthase (glutamine-hydrolysing)